MAFVFCMICILCVMLGSGLSTKPSPCKGDWELIFHAPSGNGEQFLKSWKTKHNKCDIMSGICPCSMKNGCLPPNARMEKYKTTMKTLRSPYIDFWSCLNIKKVKIELTIQGKTMAFIEFDGRGSNYLNWFHNSRIIKTSWTDMQKSGSYNFFSIDKETKYGRHFFINKKYHGCPGDEGWLVVADSIGSKPCQWEKQKTYPQFLYGKQGKSTIWNNMKFGRADVLNIYIQR
uniref:Uncharacterized protein n=2 Tax=Magallana gigas TaxID=29159 RepID=A0A8W8KYG9_MAGGI|nr:uncharacterized protein LOC105322914 [Crassostrea gigas]